MKRNIAIVAGGYSSEVVISLKSAEGLFAFIGKERYNLYIVLLTHEEWVVKFSDGSKLPINKNDFSFCKDGRKIRFDFAYITIHGTPGEDGRLQGYFDMLGLPYSSCGSLASAVTFNKYICNHYLKSFGVRIANSIRLLPGETISSEKNIFQQITFILSKDQVDVVNNALEKAKNSEEYKYIDTDGNNNANGNALFMIIQEWLAQKK